MPYKIDNLVAKYDLYPISLSDDMSFTLLTQVPEKATSLTDYEVQMLRSHNEIRERYFYSHFLVLLFLVLLRQLLFTSK